MQTGPQNVLTGFDFESEVAAWEHLDEILASEIGKGAFARIYREVPGELLQPRLGCADKTMRIDRILAPSKALLAAGWTGGLIGVEGKRSHAKIGRALTQCQDYSRTVFELPESHVLVMLRWIFLWPLECEPSGDVGSVMSQSRIGWLRSSNRTRLAFGCGGTIGIRVEYDGTIEVQDFPMGRKAGNRG